MIQYSLLIKEEGQEAERERNVRARRVALAGRLKIIKPKNFVVKTSLKRKRTSPDKLQMMIKERKKTRS